MAAGTEIPASNLVAEIKVERGYVDLGDAAAVAAAIEREHVAIRQSAVNMVERAACIGRYLQHLKKTLPHGEFGAWIAQHLTFSERTAQAYMKVAKNWGGLQANPQRAALLSLRQALAATEPEEHQQRQAQPNHEAHVTRHEQDSDAAKGEPPRPTQRWAMPGRVAYHIGKRMKPKQRRQVIAELLVYCKADVLAELAKYARPTEASEAEVSAC